MNGLDAYRGRRLELADLIRAALHIAHGYGDEESARQARQLLSRLAEDRFQLAGPGQEHADERNPRWFLPAYGRAADDIRDHFGPVRQPAPDPGPPQRGGLPIEAPLAEMARFVAQSSAERSELQVASVDVEVPAEVLRLGFEFVDTPGIGSAIEVNTATTKRFLPEADAVIFATGFDSPLTQAEVEFLADVGRHAGKLFLVINKRDLVGARDAADVLDFVGRRLRDDPQSGDPCVFGLSALEALEAALQSDAEQLSAYRFTRSCARHMTSACRCGSAARRHRAPAARGKRPACQLALAAPPLPGAASRPRI